MISAVDIAEADLPSVINDCESFSLSSLEIDFSAFKLRLRGQSKAMVTLQIYLATAWNETISSEKSDTKTQYMSKVLLGTPGSGPGHVSDRIDANSPCNNGRCLSRSTVKYKLCS
jgi:hypothetical protein